MTTITIPLSDERLAQLRAWAEQTGLSPEEFLRRRVEQLLDRPDEQFRQAATYVLKKNVVEQGQPVEPVDTGVRCDCCGSPMVVKRRPRGRFLGCGTYPRCRHTRAIKA